MYIYVLAKGVADVTDVLAVCRAAGLSHGGVCRFEDVLPLLDAKNAEKLPANAQSVLVFLFPYDVGITPKNLSRYAAVPDYHRVAGKMLETAALALQNAFPGNTFVPFVDNSPIREVRAAQLAGLGVVGKNGLLIHERFGSYVFIGEIVTDLTLAPSDPKGACPGCGLCEKACPGGAIHNGMVDQSRCLSAITQKKGALSDAEQTLIRQSGCGWGCDICSDVCPLNRDRIVSDIDAFYENTVVALPCPQTNREVQEFPFGWRGAAVVRRNYNLLEDDR